MPYSSRDIARYSLAAGLGALAAGAAVWGVAGPAALLPLMVVGLAAMAALATAHALKLRAEGDTRYRRIEAIAGLYHILQPDAPLPAVRAYSATPEFLAEVVRQVMERRPRTVVELGSGSSTLATAYALKRLGQGRVISLEHEAPFAAATRRLLDDHGLAGWATVVHAPLTPTAVDGLEVRWYDRDALAELNGDPIDVVTVDGPPGADQKLARYPAFPLLRERLAGRAVIVVDDARRADERSMVDRWTRDHPGLTATYLPTEKGTVIMEWEARGD